MWDFLTTNEKLPRELQAGHCLGLLNFFSSIMYDKKSCSIRTSSAHILHLYARCRYASKKGISSGFLLDAMVVGSLLFVFLINLALTVAGEDDERLLVYGSDRPCEAMGVCEVDEVLEGGVARAWREMFI